MFKPAERNIYEYNDGVKDVKADPLVLQRQLNVIPKKAGRDIEPLIKIVGDVQRSEVARTQGIPLDHAIYWDNVKELTDYVRQAFNVPDIQEGGLTQGELLDLLSDFMLFNFDVKKKAETLATSAECITSPRKKSRTKTITASGSTDNES